MLFETPPFLIFFAVVFIFYWKLFPKFQNLVLLASSLFFYGYYNPWLLILLTGVSLFNFISALLISSLKDKKILVSTVVVLINLGALFAFKNIDLFIQSNSWEWLSVFQVPQLGLIIPLGITFYTLQNLSYVIDVTKNKTKPLHNYFNYLLYIAYFPQLIIGPIERFNHLWPQLNRTRTWKNIDWAFAFQKIIWGLFKKIVIASALYAQISPWINAGAFNVISLSSFLVLSAGLGLYLYTEFSAYADMATGFSELLGIRLAPNFEFPFFSRNIIEFWQRWHVSFTSWIRDYVFFPLQQKTKTILGAMVGAFLSTGALTLFFHNAIFSPLFFAVVIYINLGVTGYYALKKLKWASTPTPLYRFKDIFSIILNFIFLIPIWPVLLLAEDIPAQSFLNKLNMPFMNADGLTQTLMLKIGLLFLPILIIEAVYFFNAKKNDRLFEPWPFFLKILIYAVLILSILIFYNPDPVPYQYLKY